jgi:autotransporter-associated beta strand protein
MRPLLVCSSAALILGGLLCPNILAGTYRWNGSIGTGWGNSANWTGSPVRVPNSTDVARFDTGAWTVNLGGNRSILELDFENGAAVTLGGAFILTIDGAGFGIFESSAGGAVTINCDLSLTTNQDWQNNSANSMTINGGTSLNGIGLVINGLHDIAMNGALTGSGAIGKSDGGTLTLTGNNSFSGNFAVSGGTINFAATSSLPTSASFNVNSGGTLNLGEQGNTIISYGVAGELMTLNGGTLFFGNGPAAGKSALTVWNGDVSLTAESTVTSIGGPLVDGQINGVISGGGALDVNAWLVLNNANTFTGDTRIVAGGLRLAHPNSIQNSTLHLYGPDTGALFFGSLTSATFGGLTGTRDLTLRNDGSAPVALSIGNNNASNHYGGHIYGSGSLTKVGGGIEYLDPSGNPLTDTLYTGNTVIAGGQLVLNDSSALQNSTLDYNSYGGSLQFGSQSAYTIGGLQGNQSLSLTGTSGNIALTVGNNGASTTYSGGLTDGGSLIKVGNGKLTLTGGSTYSGGTIIKDGSVWITSFLNLGTGALTLAAR